MRLSHSGWAIVWLNSPPPVRANGAAGRIAFPPPGRSFGRRGYIIDGSRLIRQIALNRFRWRRGASLGGPVWAPDFSDCDRKHETPRIRDSPRLVGSDVDMRGAPPDMATPPRYAIGLRRSLRLPLRNGRR